MMAELKPCPFCGGEAELKKYMCSLGNDGYYVVECKICGAKGKAIRNTSFISENDEKRAIEAWNRRADNDT